MFSEFSALGIVHKILKMHIKPGDYCIDATSGNGHDSVYLCELCGKEGHVLAMDIQPEAVESTKQNLAEHGFEEMTEVVCTSHSEIDKFAEPNSADCIVFNFGWLPGGSHDVFTRAETSIPAIQKSLEILKPGGLLTLCVVACQKQQPEEDDKKDDDTETPVDPGTGNGNGDQNGDQRGDEQVDHFRNMLMQPFFDVTHQQYG